MLVTCADKEPENVLSLHIMVLNNAISHESYGRSERLTKWFIIVNLGTSYSNDIPNYQS